jgi:hypothetical protein
MYYYNVCFGVTVRRAFGDRHGSRSYRLMVGLASLPAAFQTGYTAFSVTITENGFVRALRDRRGERLGSGKHTTIEDCSAPMFNC